MAAQNPIVSRLTAPPVNLAAFVQDFAASIGAIYGPEAAAAYAARAERGFCAAIAAPGASLWSIAGPEGSAALLLGALRGEIGEITLVHALAAHTGKGVEHVLVRTASRVFREAGAGVITCEAMPHGPLDLDGAFAGEGFTAVRRGLFLAETRVVASRIGPGERTGGLVPAQFRGAAACIAAAYAEDPGRAIQPEVCDGGRAYDYLLRVLAGAYGPVLPNYCRVETRDGQCVGALLGCEVAPGTGFVLQLAVRPEFRRQGIAQSLLAGFCGACTLARVPRMALGVTLDGPARALYERAGFSLLRPVTAYSWWREGAAGRFQ